MHLTILMMSMAVCTAQEVRSTSQGHVALKVVAKPLGDILECLKKTTGIDVVYDGVSAPTARVSVTLKDAPLSEALDRLMVDQQLKYALAVDPKGKRGGVLIISAGTGDGRKGGTSNAEPAPTAAPPEAPTVEEPPVAARPRATVTAEPTPVPMLIGNIPAVPGISIPGVTKVPAPTAVPLYPEPAPLTRTTR